MFRILLAALFIFMTFLNTEKQGHEYWVMCYAMLASITIIWLYFQHDDREPLF